MSCLKRALPECLAIAFAVGAVAILATAGAVGSPATKSQRPPDMIKQYQTAVNMGDVSSYITLFLEEHKTLPPSLEAVLREYGVDTRLAYDEWGRPLFYYASPHGFVLVSFGRSGRPCSQSVPPGFGSAVGDYDANLVIVNGEWAQRPTEQ